MGLFFSCCRRRKDSADHEPLLPKYHVDASANEYLPSETQLTKLADVIAALKTGKLPSQDQLGRIIQSVLRSTVIESTTRTTHGTLSDSGKQVLTDFRELLESILLLGLEKNGASFERVSCHHHSFVCQTTIRFRNYCITSYRYLWYQCMQMSL
jgi:hypothetical protein